MEVGLSTRTVHIYSLTKWLLVSVSHVTFHLLVPNESLWWPATDPVWRSSGEGEAVKSRMLASLSLH